MGTGAQVTQAEPHLPHQLQPFTGPVGSRSLAEPSPLRLTLNFLSPAPGLQLQAPPAVTRAPSFTNIFQSQSRQSLATKCTVYLVPRVSRAREERKCAQPPRAKPAQLHHLSSNPTAS